MKKKPFVAHQICWVIEDKDQFECLVRELGHFVHKLSDIVPDTDSSMAMSPGVDMRVLRTVKEAQAEERPQIARAAHNAMEGLASQKILSKLFFLSMESRQKAVSRQFAKIFEWALLPSGAPGGGGVDLAKWLRCSSGLFWIRGKAGSGKSTLMKFICENDETNLYLSEWAGDTPLRLSRFFFWRLGTEEERSQSGMFRAILYQILKQNPYLIPPVLPKMWEAISVMTKLFWSIQRQTT